MFGLLTDETLTAKFPAAERKAIREHLPWTRLVKAGNTQYNGETINLLDFIHEQREKLVLKPNDSGGDNPSFYGSEMDQAGMGARGAASATLTLRGAGERGDARAFCFRC